MFKFSEDCFRVSLLFCYSLYNLTTFKTAKSPEKGMTVYSCYNACLRENENLFCLHLNTLNITINHKNVSRVTLKMCIH